MSIVRVAVPVLQGRRKFHFDKGRPWSILEHILLSALAKQDATAKELATRGEVPQRLIIEALIRLMRAGWIEMVQRASSISFKATQTGLIAAISDELPSATRRMSRNMTFVIDQITGGVYRTREMPYLHTYMVEDRATRERIIWIERPKEILRDGIRPLMEALFLDDEKFIAMEESKERLAERWSLITVRDGKVDGLTNRASQDLVAAVESAVRDTPASGSTAPSLHRALPLPTTPSNKGHQTHNLNFLADDLVLGGNEHREAIVSVLRRARHRVIIHSTFIAESSFDALMEDFRVAISRGATIDVMWGQDESVQNVRSTRETVRRLRDKIRASGLDRFEIHPFSTKSHCKIIIADEGSLGHFTGYIGSCNWLSSSFQSFEASVRLRNPAVIADVVDQLAELSRGSNGHWIRLTGELAAVAAHLRMLKKSPDGDAQMSVVLGAQHADFVRKARDEAVNQIFVTSHRFGLASRPAVLTPALAAAHQRNVRTDVFYGTTSGPMGGVEAAGVTLDAASQGVTIRPVRKPRLHAKILAWDNDALVISSQNWLSADPPDSNPRQEIGVFVHSTNIARTLIDRFNAARMTE